MADAAQRWEPTVAGGSETGQVQGTAREQAEELKDTVRESSTQLSSTARGWLEQEADQRTTAIGSQARTIADAMRDTSSRLNDEGQSQASRTTGMLADRVDQVANYLEQTDGQRLVSDVQDAARRNPWAFAAAGLIAGFAASRFMKASRTSESSMRSMPDRSYRGTSGTQDAYGASGAYGTTGTAETLPTAPGTGTGTTGTTREYGTTGEYGDAGTYGGTGTYGESGSTGS